MKSTVSMTLRMALILAFLIGMPVLSLPMVQERVLAFGARKPSLALTRAPSSDFDFVNDAEEPASSEFPLLVTEPSEPPLVVEPRFAASQRVEVLKEQFVQLGVSYMVLEQSGVDSSKYRFRCDVPVVAGSAYIKRFQVIADAPDGAMQQVLDELQQWRLAAHDPAGLARPTVRLR